MNLSKKLITTVCAAIFTFSIVGSSNAAPLSRKPQDNLFFASSTEPLGMDPALVDDTDSSNAIANIYDSLLRFGQNDTEIRPALAEKWDISEDGKVYTFYLRKGVKFHDGTPFNAEAVKFNIDRQMPAVRTPMMTYAPLVFDGVVSTEVVDEYTVRITLEKSTTPFLRNLAMTLSAPIASPTAIKKYNNNINAHPCGTGPYKFVAWDKGQQIILTANEDYWDGAPKVQNVIYRLMKETSARVVALNNGEVDVITGIDANVIPEIKAAGNIIGEIPGNNTNYMIFNCRSKYITSNVDVRRALAQAVNVPELVDSLYKGYASYATTFLPTFMSGYDPNLKPVSYDPEAAKKFLAQKGIKEIKIMTYSNNRFYNTVGGQVLAEAVQAYYNKIGLKASIIVYDWATFKSKLTTDDWDVSFVGWIGDNGDPDNFLNILSVDDPISNQGLWLNDEFISIIKEAVHVPNGPEREALYKKAEQIIVDDVGVLPISHAKTLIAYRPNVKNVMPDPIGNNHFVWAEKTAAK